MISERNKVKYSRHKHKILEKFKAKYNSPEYQQKHKEYYARKQADIIARAYDYRQRQKAMKSAIRLGRRDGTTAGVLHVRKDICQICEIHLSSRFAEGHDGIHCGLCINKFKLTRIQLRYKGGRITGLA